MSGLPISELDQQILREFAADLLQVQLSASRLHQRLQQALATSSHPDEPEPFKLISVGAAGKIANLTNGRIRTLCGQHRYPAGFGFKRGGRWSVVEAPFRRYLDRARV